MRVCVVGAGIVGAAIAFELRRLGVEVVIFDPLGVMAARSKGDTRIFRTTHASADLVDAALEAVQDWRRWSDAAGSELVGSQGVLVTGASAEPYLTSAAAGRRPWRLAAASDVLALPGVAASPAVLDTVGGVIDMSATRSFLERSLSTLLVRSEVRDVQHSGSTVVVTLDDGSTQAFDKVVIAAGEGTATVARSVALKLSEQTVRHSRFTFATKRPLDTPPAWIGTDDTWRDGFSFYGHQVGADRWALGAHIPDSDSKYELGKVEVERRSSLFVIAYVREKLPLLSPDPIDVVNCTHPVLPRGDGFAIRWGRAGCYVWGHNLAKFAPHIGRHVAELVHSEGIPQNVECGLSA